MANITRNIAKISHFHVAYVPGRHGALDSEEPPALLPLELALPDDSGAARNGQHAFLQVMVA